MNSDTTGSSSSNRESREKLNNSVFLKKPQSFETGIIIAVNKQKNRVLQ